jgi:hypothetical protein
MTKAELVGTPTPNVASEPGKVLWDVRVKVRAEEDGDHVGHVTFPVLAVTSQRLPGLMRKSAAGELEVKLG